MLFNFKRPHALRKAGDKFRDKGDFIAAEAAYRAYLAAEPADPVGHCQLGHALSRQGNFGLAAEAYAAALALAESSETLNDLAEALLRSGRWQAALPLYRKSLLLRFDAAVAETIATLAARTIFFVIQDLLEYLKAHGTMSGIQRVQAGIGRQVMDGPDVDARFILTEIGTRDDRLQPGEYWQVRADDLRRLLDYAEGADVDSQRLQQLIKACEAGAEVVQMVAGNVALLLGSFWGWGSTVESFVAVRADGVLLGIFIHDIIPLTHPDYCDAELTADFAKGFCEACATADFILTNSETTRRAVAAMLASQDARPIPVAAVPLAHTSIALQQLTAHWPTALNDVRGRPYALCVGTLEARKNHIYLVECWRRLIAEGVDVPDLVFVGRVGWRVDPLMALLGRTNNLGGRIHIVSNLSDGELQAVYRDCQFTLFPSFVEGWGLPIGESLTRGVPCVASRLPITSEVGEDLVDLLDPHDIEDGVDVLRRMITDSDYRAARRQKIADQFVPRTWRDVTEELLASVARLAARGPLAAPPLAAPPGVPIQLANLAAQSDLPKYLAFPVRLILPGTAFYRLEAFGAWIRGNQVRFVVPTMLAPGRSAFLFVQLVAPQWARDCEIGLRIAAPGSHVARPSTLIEIAATALIEGASLRLPTQVAPDGSIAVDIEISGDYRLPEDQTRRFALGLAGFGYAETSDFAGCRSLIAAFGLNSAVV